MKGLFTLPMLAGLVVLLQACASPTEIPVQARSGMASGGIRQSQTHSPPEELERRLREEEDLVNYAGASHESLLNSLPSHRSTAVYPDEPSLGTGSSNRSYGPDRVGSSGIRPDSLYGWGMAQ